LIAFVLRHFFAQVSHYLGAFVSVGNTGSTHTYVLVDKDVHDLTTTDTNEHSSTPTPISCHRHFCRTP
jgi:hypothetical protein